MIFALDYDNTYTQDPVLWERFIADAKTRNHEVKIVTMRYPHEEIKNMSVEVIYTSRKAKNSALTADIWIDDSPHYIYRDSL